MERRTFVGAMAGGLLAAPLAAEAQQAAKVPRIGVIVPVEPDSPTEPNLAAFRQGLRSLGYAEGQNIAVEYRYAHGNPDLYPTLAAELVRLSVDVIVVGSTIPTVAVKNETTTIPIIGVGLGSDPVRVGLVASLARPGGNVTGLAWATGGGYVGKLVELLKEAAPQTAHVGFLHDERNPSAVLYSNELHTAAQSLAMTFQDLGVHEFNEVRSGLAALSRARGPALIVPGDLMLMRHASQIMELAAKYRLPAIYGVKEAFMEAGGLMSYSPSLPDQWRRAAVYADKILKGAKPADLPIEQPTKFELVINLKTAKALGLTIPQSLLQRADQVIE